jgi:hypothetical protein
MSSHGISNQSGKMFKKSEAPRKTMGLFGYCGITCLLSMHGELKQIKPSRSNVLFVTPHFLN